MTVVTSHCVSKVKNYIFTHTYSPSESPTHKLFSIVLLISDKISKLCHELTVLDPVGMILLQQNKKDESQRKKCNARIMMHRED